jgi:hypothetical protein
MWVEYTERETKKKKKFNVPKDSIPPLIDRGSEIWDYVEEDSVELVGYAVLTKDSIQQVGQWATYNSKGEEHVNYPPGHPLLFPAEFKKLPQGTVVELYVPVKK